MRRLITLGLIAVLLVVFAAPTMTRAALNESQIQAIISLVQAFGADPSIVTTVEDALRGRSSAAQQVSDTVVKPSTATETPGALCKRILDNQDVSIHVGVQSDVARELQDFLTVQGYFDFSGGSTGYYGTVTAGALCDWQIANGVVSSRDSSTGCGTFGPLTRDRLTYICEYGGGVPVPSPTPAPGFCTTEYAPVCGQVGNNAPQTYGNKCELNNAQATFLYTGQCTDSSTGSTSGGACTLEYAPVCGQVPGSNAQTYSNKCFLNSVGASFLYSGECTTDSSSTDTTRTYDAAGNTDTTDLRDDTSTGFCTADAYQCPDGTWVGRTTSQCIFDCGDYGTFR